MDNGNEEGYTVLADGSNIAFFNPTSKRKGRYQNLKILRETLEIKKNELPFKYQIMVDATLLHRIDNKDALKKAIKTGVISQCPNNTSADFFLMEYHKRHEGKVIIISNDNFREYEVKNLFLCKFAFIFEDFILTPSIEDYINGTYEKPKGGK